MQWAYFSTRMNKKKMKMVREPIAIETCCVIFFPIGSKLPLDFSTAWKSSLPRLPDAVRLQSSKAEMKPSEARNFHRPRVKYSRGDIVKIFTSDPGGGVKKTTT